MNFNIQDLMFFLPMIAIIYFMIFLPKKREAAALQKMLGGLKKGDKVQTHAGMIGEVSSIKDKIVTLKFHDNVRIDFTNSAILRTIEEKEEAKA